MNDPAPGHRLVPSGVTRISFSNDDHHDEHEHQKHDTCVDDPSCGAPTNAGTTRTIDALSEQVGVGFCQPNARGYWVSWYFKGIARPHNSA